MADMAALDRVHDVVLDTFIERGYGPHYTEVAVALGVAPRTARELLRQLVGQGIAAWFAPDTDWIASFSPFSNQPTQDRVSVDGVQKWFGQCGFESLAICWLFPGRSVSVDSPCLDCGEPIRITVRDAEGGLLPLADLMTVFSAPVFRERRNGSYISRRPALRADMLAIVKAVTHDHPFWRPPAP